MDWGSKLILFFFLLDLHSEEGDAGQEVHCRFEVLQRSLLLAGKLFWEREKSLRITNVTSKIVNEKTVYATNTHSIHWEVNAQGIVQLIQQLDKPFFLQDEKN